MRQQVAGAGEEALALFAADKLSKLRELRRETAGDLAGSVAPLRIRQLRARRLRHYQRSLALLEERLPDSPLVRGLRDELAVLGGDQPKLVPPTRQNGINKLVPPTPQDGSNLVSRTAGRRAAGSLARCPG